MARSLRLQFEGAMYHLVVRANNRQPLFRSNQDRRRYLDLLARYQDQFGLRIYCYLLMNREVHLLIETPRGNVSKAMQCLGTSYTSYFNRRHRRRGTLFEGRYRSYLIDNKSDLPEVTRYIHRVQLHSGLKIKNKRDYTWSSYRLYLGRKFSNLIDTGTVLKCFGRGIRDRRKRYQQFVENGGVRENGYPRWVNSKPIMGPDGLVKIFFLRAQTSQSNNEEASLRKAEKILRAVSLSLDTSGTGVLLERRRNAFARHVAMYLIRNQTSLPLRSIGKLLGVKAPAVALGIGKVEQLLKREDCSRKVKDLLATDTFSSPDTDGEYVPSQQELASGSEIS